MEDNLLVLAISIVIVLLTRVVFTGRLSLIHGKSKLVISSVEKVQGEIVVEKQFIHLVAKAKCGLTSRSLCLIFRVEFI